MQFDYHVPISSCPILRDVPFVLCLLWLGAAIGRSVLRGFRVPDREATRLEVGLFSASIGVGLLQYLFFALGNTGNASPRAIWVGMIALVVIFSRSMWAVARAVIAGVRGLHRRSLPAWAWVVVAIVAVILTVELLYALSPPVDYDGLTYHLTAPKRWLQMGRMGYLPSFPMTLWPMGVEMLYGSAMAVWSDTAAKLIHYALGVLALLAVYGLGRRVSNGVVGVLALGLFLAGCCSELGSAYVDLGVVLQTTCALVAWCIWLSGRKRSWLLAAGLLAGLSASFKLTGIFLGVVLAAATLVEMLRSKEDARVITTALFAFLLLAWLPVVPWLLRSWALTGNPVYPLLSSHFRTLDWNPSAERWHHLLHNYFNWARSHPDWNLATRKRIIFGCETGVSLLALAYVLLVRRRDLQLLAFVWCALTLVLVHAAGPYPRFFMPLSPLLSVLALAPFASRLESPRWGPWLATCLIAFVSLQILGQTASGLSLAAKAAVGAVSRKAYLEASCPTIDALWYINEKLPKDARVLSTVETTYYSDRFCEVAFSFQGAIRLDSWQNVLADARRARIGYLLVSPVQPFVPGQDPENYAATTKTAPACVELAERCGILLVDAGGDRLYRLVDPSPVIALSRSDQPGSLTRDAARQPLPQRRGPPADNGR